MPAQAMTHRSRQSHCGQLLALTLSAQLTYRARIDFKSPPTRRGTADKMLGVDRRVCFAPADRFPQAQRGFMHAECRQDADEVNSIIKKLFWEFRNRQGLLTIDQAPRKKATIAKNPTTGAVIPLLDRVSFTRGKLNYRAMHDAAIPPQERR